MRMPAHRQLQVVSKSEDANGSSHRASMPVAHLSTEQFVKALKASSGIMADAARRLGISRSSLHDRCKVDPEAEAARVVEREVLIDTAPAELVKLIKAGNPQAVFFVCERSATCEDGARVFASSGRRRNRRARRRRRQRAVCDSCRVKSWRRWRSSFSRWKARPPFTTGSRRPTTTSRLTTSARDELERGSIRIKMMARRPSCLTADTVTLS